MTKHRFTDEELDDMQDILLKVQDGKEKFVTVAEAADAMDKSTTAAFNRLDALVKDGRAIYSDGHYHIVEVE
jgi:hypothetical protein